MNRYYVTNPFSVIALLLVIGLVIVMIPLLVLGLVGAHFSRLGFSWPEATMVILLMIFGSFINIPVKKMKRQTIRVEHNEGALYDAGNPPGAEDAWFITIAINLGGAVIPFSVSVYLFSQVTKLTGILPLIPVAVSILIVAGITKVATRVVTGNGIRAPLFIPGLTALLCGLLLTGGTGLLAAVIAFSSGTMGTLLGASILNLHRVRDLEVPLVSIGGAGTFGAVFFCGIFAALIA